MTNVRMPQLSKAPCILKTDKVMTNRSKLLILHLAKDHYGQEIKICMPL